jgi:hypothetical protein
LRYPIHETGCEVRHLDYSKQGGRGEYFSACYPIFYLSCNISTQFFYSKLEIKYPKLNFCFSYPT